MQFVESSKCKTGGKTGLKPHRKPDVKPGQNQLKLGVYRLPHTPYVQRRFTKRARLHVESGSYHFSPTSYKAPARRNLRASSNL